MGSFLPGVQILPFLCNNFSIKGETFNLLFIENGTSFDINSSYLINFSVSKLWAKRSQNFFGGEWTVDIGRLWLPPELKNTSSAGQLQTQEHFQAMWFPQGNQVLYNVVTKKWNSHERNIQTSYRIDLWFYKTLFSNNPYKILYSTKWCQHKKHPNNSLCTHF